MLIMLVVLLLFGAKRLPEVGSSIGKGIREFKRSLVRHAGCDHGPGRAAAATCRPAPPDAQQPRSQPDRGRAEAAVAVSGKSGSGDDRERNRTAGQASRGLLTLPRFRTCRCPAYLTPPPAVPAAIPLLQHLLPVIHDLGGLAERRRGSSGTRSCLATLISRARYCSRSFANAAESALVCSSISMT